MNLDSKTDESFPTQNYSDNMLPNRYNQSQRVKSKDAFVHNSVKEASKIYNAPVRMSSQL